jgi:hypothetical protein
MIISMISDCFHLPCALGCHLSDLLQSLYLLQVSSFLSVTPYQLVPTVRDWTEGLGLLGFSRWVKVDRVEGTHWLKLLLILLLIWLVLLILSRLGLL